MTDTVDVDLAEASWTEFADNTTGIVSNSSVVDIIVREDASDPTATVTTGHVLNPNDTFNFVLAAGQKMWGRSLGGVGLAVVTGAA